MLPASVSWHDIPMGRRPLQPAHNDVDDRRIIGRDAHKELQRSLKVRQVTTNCVRSRRRPYLSALRIACS